MAIKITYDANTTAIKDKLWPLVEEAMKKSNVKSAYKRLINEFVSNRAASLYDTVPCDRLICSEKEMDKLFDALKIQKSTVKSVIDQTYYGNIDHFSPLAAKHEYTILTLLIIRYYLLEANKSKSSKVNISKDCELSLIHLSFSGKFYPSIHYNSYRMAPVRRVMEYVINNKLSKKFDIITYGSILGAINSVGVTWINTYIDRFIAFSDEDVVYLINQLISRITSFMVNIAREYYDAYEQGLSIRYSSDSYEEDDFHLADSDTLRISKITEKTINAINSTGADFRICKMCSTTDITSNECKAVIESIICNRENIPEMKELISLMISLYFSTGERDVTDIKFITYTISAKPNAKQKEIVRLKEIIEDWLCESGTAYMKRRSRIATRNAYERAVRMYFALVIHNSNR